MAHIDDWNKLLRDHPIFSLPKSAGPKFKDFLELSTTTLPNFTNANPRDDNPSPSGRRRTMILKDADIIVAAGKEVRMSSFGDIKLSQSVRKSYKTLHTPTVEFEIHQMALNPSGKLLAVAGAFQVAVIVLPRPGYSRLVPDTVDCKAVQVGQYYHASTNSPRIAKIDWHPWGEAGSTLLVMTVDGKLREYDISADTEEPQEVLTFVPERKSKSYMAEDDSEREVASFTLGKGRADWGPLTVYAVMKSGDTYAISPYMPRNASIPSAYVHSLECFIAAKQEFISEGTSAASKSLSAVYDYQRKYVTALVKQLPPGSAFPALSRSFPMHPPTTIGALPLRQGPFLLQPSPPTLAESEGGDATDILYLDFGADHDDQESTDTEHLGVIMISYQDGKVDLFLDVEKVEARWDLKKLSNRDLPMLAVYETIDLGLFHLFKNGASSIPPSLPDLIRGNFPVLLPDPLHDDIVYVGHAFGVHVIDIAPVLQHLAAALHAAEDDDEKLQHSLEKGTTSNVQAIFSTYNPERKSSNPVTSIAIPNDVYLSYSILILSSNMRLNCFSLNIRSTSPPDQPKALPPAETPTLAEASKNKWYIPLEGPPAYVSALGKQSYEPPQLTSKDLGIPPTPKSASVPGAREFVLNGESLRFIATSVSKIVGRIHDVQLAFREATARAEQQRQELIRMTKKSVDLEVKMQDLKGPKQADIDDRVGRVQEEQKRLLARLDRLLQAMMEKASPSLSEHETKWFEELKRMKEDVIGSGKYDEDSLLTRTRLLEREYARLLPALKALCEKEKQRSQRYADNQLGFSKAFEYGEKSHEEKTKIDKLKKQVTQLAAKLDMPIPRSE